jgi:hypothetical protein
MGGVFGPKPTPPGTVKTNQPRWTNPSPERRSTCVAPRRPSIIRVLEDENLRGLLKTTALKKVETFNIKRQAEQLVSVYWQAIEDKAHGRLIQVDKQKPLLKEKWYELLGLEQNPFKI